MLETSVLLVQLQTWMYSRVMVLVRLLHRLMLTVLPHSKQEYVRTQDGQRGFTIKQRQLKTKFLKINNNGSSQVILLNHDGSATFDGQLTAGGTYPTTNGTSGQVLTSDGSGNVTWSDGDYVSVKDFGAVGDGSANDTTAIQNAINSGAKQNFHRHLQQLLASMTMHVFAKCAKFVQTTNSTMFGTK